MPLTLLPQAKQLTPSAPGGQMDGRNGIRACVWHTVEAPYSADVDSMAAYLIRSGFEPHIVWHPVTGELRQLLPANVAGRALKNDGDLRTNRVGQIRIQIEVVGQAAHPFTDTPMAGRSALIAWLDALGIPHAWPFGPLLPYPQSYGTGNGTRDLTTYLTRSGHMGHSNVPGNDHGDPGAISQTKLVPPKPTTPKDDDMTLDEFKAAIKSDPELRRDLATAVWGYANPSLTSKDAYAHLLTAGPVAGDKAP